MATPTTLAHQGYSYRYRRIPAHRSTGSMPPVIFLSGAFQSMESWRRFVDAFVPQSDVVLVDLPGSGAADPLPPEFGLDFLTDALHRVLLELSLPRAYMVCASYGSPIGYRFAQRFPERISHLVLAGVMDAIPDRVRAPMERAVTLAASGRLEEFSSLTLSYLLCQDPRCLIARRNSVERALRRGLTRMSQGDLRRFVWNTQRLLKHPPLDLTRPPEAPTLVFTGEHDAFTPPEQCRRVADHIPGARFTTIARADHIFHLQRFDATVDLLTGFVQGRLPGTVRDVGSDEPELAARAE